MQTPYRKLNQQFVEHLGATISQYWPRERVRQGAFVFIRLVPAAILYGIGNWIATIQCFRRCWKSRQTCSTTSGNMQ